MHTLRACLYLHPNVHHRGIQEVKDSGGNAISSVLGEPAIAAQCVLGAQGGHSQTQLLHQPAALGGGPIMAQLGGDTRGCEGLGTPGKEALPALLSIPFSLLPQCFLPMCPGFTDPSPSPEGKRFYRYN